MTDHFVINQGSMNTLFVLILDVVLTRFGLPNQDRIAADVSWTANLVAWYEPNIKALIYATLKMYEGFYKNVLRP